MAKQFQVDTGGTLNTSLISYFKLEDASDYFGANTLTNNNSVAFNAGKVGNAADTGSSNSTKSLTIGSALGINGGAVSMSFWMKLSATISSATTFLGQQSNGSTNTGYEFEYDGTTLTFNRFKNGTSDNTATESVSLSTGTWYHIVGTYDGTTLQLYRNNVAKGSLTTSGSGASATTQKFSIFNNPNIGTRFFSGMIDEVGVWSKVLTTTEINDLYNSGNGQTMVNGQNLSASATGLVSLSKSLVFARSLSASATAVLSLAKARLAVRTLSVAATGLVSVLKQATFTRVLSVQVVAVVSILTTPFLKWAYELKNAVSWVLESRADERLWDDIVTTWNDPVATWDSQFTQFSYEAKNATSFTYETKNT